MRWARRLKSLSSMAYSLARRLWDDAATPFRRQDGCHADRAAICDRGAPWPGPRHPPRSARRHDAAVGAHAPWRQGRAEPRGAAPVRQLRSRETRRVLQAAAPPRDHRAPLRRVCRGRRRTAALMRPPGGAAALFNQARPTRASTSTSRWHRTRAPRLAPSGAGTRSAASCTTTIARRPRSCIPRRLNSCTLRARRSASARTARAGSHPYPASRRTTDQAPAARRSTTDAGRHLLMSPG